MNKKKKSSLKNNSKKLNKKLQKVNKDIIKILDKDRHDLEGSIPKVGDINAIITYGDKTYPAIVKSININPRLTFWQKLKNLFSKFFKKV